MKEMLVLVNPTAGRGRALRWIRREEATLLRQYPGASVILTSEPGEARRLAETAPPEIRLIVAVGGDGTINEIINGMNRERTTLALVPVGSGNDLVKSLDIPGDPSSAVRLIKFAHTRTIDCGSLNGRLFVNSLAMGIDGAVARWIEKNRWLPASFAYQAGILSQIFTFRNRTFTWESDIARGEITANLLAVMNGHSYGGGYKIAPQAVVDDGSLDFVAVGNYGILGRIRHLPKVKTGDHLDLDEVTWLDVRNLRISCEDMPPVAVDGELLSQEEVRSELQIKIVPEALKVIVPPAVNENRHH